MNAYISTAPAYQGSAESIEGTSSSRRATRVLVAAGDNVQRLSLADALNARGCVFAICATVDEVLVQLRAGGFDLVVAALRDAESLELLRLVRQTMPSLAVIMVAPGAELNGSHLDCAKGLKREMFGENISARLTSLTLRERQVLSLIVAGRANKVIAYELAISPRTVENHRARVMEKLRVKSVAELVRIALGAEVPSASVKLVSSRDTGDRNGTPVTA